MYLSTYVHMYLSTHVHMYLATYVHMYLLMYICIYLFTYVSIYYLDKQFIKTCFLIILILCYHHSLESFIFHNALKIYKIFASIIPTLPPRCSLRPLKVHGV